MENEEFEKLLSEAESLLTAAKTKADVAAVWKQFYLKLGHKALGRLLIGKSSSELVEKREKVRA